MSAIYLHIPFCKRLCGYCDFFKSVKLQYLDAVLESMERELVDEKGFLGDDAESQQIETIYFGGGTPSLISPSQVKRFLDIISDNYSTDALCEVTIEVNPDDISLSYLTELREAGVNRLSIGIQSFDDSELKFMNRRHSSQQAIDSVRMAQSVGFDNITIDLIFGVEGFGEDVLRHSIQVALSLKVQHISAYHLTIEGGTQFARKVEQGAMKVVSDEVSQAEYALLERELTTAGYEHYEVSNYALPNFRSRHNSSYWKGVKYLGIGPGAHAYNGSERRMAVDSIEKYLLGGDDRYEREKIYLIERFNELIMTSLRCCEGVDLLQLRAEFPAKFYDHIQKNGLIWLKEGRLIEGNGKIFIPTKYFLISDLIIESLFYTEV
ncbi:MAG: radical SAM family heme chaperone HemW [Rikenellaceae bacterium]